MANRTAEPMARELSHEETLNWINQHRAWRLARKTKPMWVREVGPDEADKEFQTADRAIEKPKPGHLLCVGVAGEPWFQKAERVATRFELVGEEQRQFSFDSEPQTYRIYRPKESTRNWAARVADPSIAGFTVRPNYDVEHPLYSPSGGFVVRDYCDDPYSANPDDVWLVQEPLFLSTYELIDDGDE